MNKGEQRTEFLNALNGIRNHMNWCKIKLNPEEQEEINDPRIEYDYVAWEAEDDLIMDRIMNEIKDIEQLDLMDLILRIHIMLCEYFVFDDFCYFLGKYDKEKGICTIDQKYGRNPNARWREERKKHNKRICFELSRYVACRIKQFANQECNVFLVSDEYETHYATAVISEDFMIIIDADDFFKGEDLNRVKLGLEIKGITIISDEKGVVAQALEKINLNRKSKKEFEEEAKDDPEKKANYEWIESLLKRIQIIGNDGIFKYMNQILQFRGYEPRKIWVKDGDRYIQSLYLEWDMGYIVINELRINILTKKEFGENIYEGKYQPNKYRKSVAEEIEYNDDVNIFECIKIMNKTNIDYKIKNNKDYKIDIEIRNMLKDEALFLKITKQRALQLLEALEIKKEKINQVYAELISEKVFYNLLHNKKIDIYDKNLLIKYPIYNVF